ncbi:MAG: glycosyltransferase family 39 protein [Chloroflexota bacterium]|nr:glycosyltransferase family 39 protein [Chloroflexota bacterium]
MSKQQKRANLWLLGLSLVLAVTGQYYLANKRQFMWDGILLYALAMVLFAWVSARIESGGREKGQKGFPGLWRGIWRALNHSVLRLALFLSGIALVMFVSFAASSRSGSRPFYDLLALWGVGILTTGGACIPWQDMTFHPQEWWKRTVEQGPEALLILVLALATFLTRVVNLENIPFVLDGDEAAMGLEAVAVIEGRRVNPFVTGWLSHPTLYFFLQSLFLRLFGISIAALRFSSAFISPFIVILLYFFTRRLYGRWVAILSATFFAAYHYPLHFGRIALNNIWDPFFALGAIYFLTVGLEERQLASVLVGGVLTGMAIYFYMGSRLLPIILVLYLLYWALTETNFLWENAVYLFLFGLMAFLVALPLLNFFRTHPEDLVARWEWVGVFSSDWAKGEMQKTGKTVWGLMPNQLLKSVLAFNYFSDPTFFYHPNTPLLHFGSSIFFVVGLTYSLRRWRERRYFLLLLWFFLVILFGGVLLENPPSSARFVLSIPPVVLFVVFGVFKVSSYIQNSVKALPKVAMILSLVLILFLSYHSLYFYFCDYSPQHLYSSYGNTEVATAIAQYLNLLDADYRWYFFGPPRIYHDFPVISFLAPEAKGMDVEESVSGRVDFVDPVYDAVFVFLPERRSEFETVRRRYPAGAFREFTNGEGRLLFVSYEVDL